jgi:hypothetical protein
MASLQISRLAVAVVRSRDERFAVRLAEVEMPLSRQVAEPPTREHIHQTPSFPNTRVIDIALEE